MKPLTASRLAAAMGIGDEAAELWVMHVNTALGMCGCNTPEHVAMWIAQPEVGQIRNTASGVSLRLVLPISADGVQERRPARLQSRPELDAAINRRDRDHASSPAVEVGGDG